MNENIDNIVFNIDSYENNQPDQFIQKLSNSKNSGKK